MANPTLYICGECVNEVCESSGTNRTCVNCGGFKGKPRKLTHADIIRNTTDEDMAKVIAWLVVVAFDQVFPDTEWKGDYESRINGTSEDLLEWLKREAKCER